MAFPALPTSPANNSGAAASWARSVRDMLEWFRDTRPLFRGTAETPLNLSSGTAQEIGHGAVASTFDNTPDTNVGTFTVASGANGDGAFNIEVPDAGFFSIKR